MVEPLWLFQLHRQLSYYWFTNPPPIHLSLQWALKSKHQTHFSILEHIIKVDSEAAIRGILLKKMLLKLS